MRDIVYLNDGYFLEDGEKAVNCMTNTRAELDISRMCRVNKVGREEEPFSLKELDKCPALSQQVQKS